MMWGKWGIGLCAALVMTGCSEGHLLEEGFEADLSRSGGCGDLVLWAGSEGKDIGMEFRALDIAQAAHDAGTAQTVTLDLSAEGALVIQMGEFITEGYCVDVPLPEDAVKHTYVAVQGTATLTVTPNLDTSGGAPLSAEAEVVLEDVVFQLDGKSSVTLELDRFEMDGTVGWFAG